MASNRRGRVTVLLLTGAPGIGKTTVAEKVARGLGPRPPRGFLTREMVSEDDRRWGFRIETFDGRSVVVAHQRILSRHRVGRYGIDVRAIDRLAEAELQPAGPGDLVLVDEIRPLLCAAPRFVERIEALVLSGHPLVATLAWRAPPLVAALRRRGEAEVWEITPGNRDHLPEAVLGWIAARTPEAPTRRTRLTTRRTSDSSSR